MAATPCPVHPASLVTSACARCGAFVCPSCTENGRYDTCEKCRARGVAAELPFQRERFKLFEVFNRCVELYLAHWVPFTVVGVIAIVGSISAYYGPVIVAGMFARGLENPYDAMPVQMAANAVGTLAMGVVFGVTATVGSQLAANAFRREPIALVWDFAKILRAAFAGILLSLPMAAAFLLVAMVQFRGTATPEQAMRTGAAGLGILCGICVYFVALPAWYFLFPIIARGNRGVLGSIGALFRMLGTRPGAVLGGSLLITLVYVAGIIALCVGMIPAAGVSLLFAAALTELLAQEPIQTGAPR